MDLITSRNNILLAYRNIKGNKGSRTSGIDKLNILYVNEQDTEKLVEMIQAKFNNYQPQRVRRVEIPKNDDSGKTRPLGIPTITDRLMQQCMLQILEPICEARFSDNSYGFRPNRSCENAIANAMYCMQRKNMHYCVDIDIRGFFDNVNHGKLLKQIWTLGIRDKKVLAIISKILKSEIIMPNGDIVKPQKGTPQGGIISPLLSNIVLNELDKWVEGQWSTKTLKQIKPYFNKDGSRNTGNEYKFMRKHTSLKEMHIVRYADDFKIFTNNVNNAKKIFAAVRMWLKDRLDLDISPEKSKITNLRKNYTIFLGFKLKVRMKGNKHVVKSHVSDKAKSKITKTLIKQVKYIQHSKNEIRAMRIWLFNSKVIGYHNYYWLATNGCIDFNKIAFSVSRALKHRLNPKWQGKASGYIKERYGKSNLLKFVDKIPIIPIGYVRTKSAMCKKRITNDFTIEGRKEIHKNLENIDINILHYLMENVLHDSERIEFFNNKISLYSGQNGKCYITGEPLSIGDMHCHHKKPYYVSHDDSYNNLVWVSEKVHKLLHATVAKTIEYYMKKLSLDNEQIAKVNKLRKSLQIQTI